MVAATTAETTSRPVPLAWTTIRRSGIYAHDQLFVRWVDGGGVVHAARFDYWSSAEEEIDAKWPTDMDGETHDELVADYWAYRGFGVRHGSIQYHCTHAWQVEQANVGIEDRDPLSFAARFGEVR